MKYVSVTTEHNRMLTNVNVIIANCVATGVTLNLLSHYATRANRPTDRVFTTHTNTTLVHYSTTGSGLVRIGFSWKIPEF